jgi:transcription antitermination factor NusG
VSETVWRAYYCKPRHEKKAKERLEAAGFTVFCPLIKTKVKWSDRWKKVQKPAMPGYLFAKVDEDGRKELLQDESILNCVFWNKKPVSILDAEIDAIRFLLDHAEDILIEPARPQIPSGATVRLDHGPFAGHDLIVLDTSRTTARLSLPALGCVLVAKLGNLVKVEEGPSLRSG